MADTSNKTEKPTPKRRREARRKGEVARSSELPQSVSLIVSAVMLPMLMPELIDRLAATWKATFGPDVVRDAETVIGAFGSMTDQTMRVMLPMVLAVAATSVLSQLVLVGGRPNVRQLKPKWAYIDPRQGVKRLFGVQVLWELGRTMAKLALVSLVAWSVWDATVSSLLVGPTPMTESLPAVVQVLEDLFIRVAVLGVVIGVADAVFNKRRFDKSLRMSKEEVKEEYKQQEANPQVKAEIRRRAMLLSRNRMIADVAHADVVITNPTHLAVALAYESGDLAPRVVAKGAGLIAQRIREEARLHGVPIREDKPVARSLYRNVEVGDLIPIELYAAVAEILAAVYRARRRRR